MITATKKYKVPSESQPGILYTITEFITSAGSRFECECAARKECKHIRAIKKWQGRVQGPTRKCFYSGSERNLEEHHLLRSGLRAYSLTVYLTSWIHRLATYDKEFEEHLVHLFFDNDDMPIDIKFKANIKEVKIRNLESMDKGIMIVLHSHEIEEAIKLAKLEEEKLVKVSFPGDKLFAIVGRVKKENLKQGENDRVEVALDAAPGELGPALKLAELPIVEEVEVEYKDNGS